MSSDDKTVSLDIQEINLDALSNTPRDSYSIDKSIDNDIRPVSSSLGDGIEFLMNEKVKNSQNGGGDSSNKSMEQELNDLNELNAISIEPEFSTNSTGGDYKAKNSFLNKPAVEIAKGTSKMDENMDSWDGFKDINQINIETSNEKSTKLTEQELLRGKFELLRKLESLEEKGANLSKKYSMDNDLDEMKGEYEFLINEKEKSNSMKFQGKVLTTMITGL